MRVGLGVGPWWLVGVFVSWLSAAAMMGQGSGAAVLKPEAYRHYVERFREQEKEATGTVGADPWNWMQREIPWFDSSDKSFEEMYYFRWYAFKKHILHTPSGYLITEWLDRPEMTDRGTLSDAAPFHLNEARWLHNRSISEDYARYWYLPASKPRNYSQPLTTAVRDVTLATGDTTLTTSLLPEFVRVYHDWES